MAKRPPGSPGTVSKILWHFTGGPVWNAATKTQDSSPKPASDAYNNLKSILKSRVVRLGSYKERVKVVLPEHRMVDRQTRKITIKKNFPVTIESSPICCVSDIPAPHLHYHAYRYGKFAIGFRRRAVIGAGFNPVFYTLHDTPIVRSIYEGFSALRLADVQTIRDAADQIELAVDDYSSDHDDVELDVSGEVYDLQTEADSLDETLDAGRQSLKDFVAFVKTFDSKEFGTIYCEREWRSTQAFKFRIDDVAMVVLPRSIGGKRYFRRFVDKVAPALGLSRRIPIVPWEDLVEH